MKYHIDLATQIVSVVCLIPLTCLLKWFINTLPPGLIPNLFLTLRDTLILPHPQRHSNPTSPSITMKSSVTMLPPLMSTTSGMNRSTLLTTKRASMNFGLQSCRRKARHNHCELRQGHLVCVSGTHRNLL